MSEGLPASTDKQWARVRARLRQEFRESVYRSWLKPLTLEKISNDKVSLVAPTPFMRDRIVSQYRDRIHAAWITESSERVSRVEIISSSPPVNRLSPESRKELGDDYLKDDYDQVKDIVEVWFDSGSTHAFCLEKREDLLWPA